MGSVFMMDAKEVRVVMRYIEEKMTTNEFWGDLLLVYLILKPFYIFASGSLQPADFFLMLCFGLLLVTRKTGFIKYPIPSGIWKILRWSVLFAFYQIFINLIWYLILENTNAGNKNYGLYLSCFFILFNLFSVFSCIMIYERIGPLLFQKLIKGFLISATIVAFFSIIQNASSSIRAVAGFNNPNQLGYYAILLLTSCFLFGGYIRSPYKQILFSLSVYLNVISLSKASVLSSAILILYVILFQKYFNVHISNKMTVFLVIFILFILYSFFFGDLSFFNNDTLSALRERILNIRSEGDSNLGSGRGYTRIFEMGSHLLWGMGEGAYYRFQSLTGLEAHSSFVTVFVSYGLVGFLIWMRLLIAMVYSGIRRNLFTVGIFIGVAAYWVTHNGLRNTVLWIIIASYMIMNHSGEKEGT